MLKHDYIPQLLQIELTYKCNQNCVFCYNPLREKEISMDKLDDIVDAVSKSKIPNVYLIGGEPSLLGSDKLNEYIEKLSDTSSVTIVTNGYIRLENISNKLACMAVALHGYDANTHEMVNRKKGSFKKVIENIKYYVDQGLDVRIISVLTGYNYNYIDKIMNLAIDLGVKSIYIDRYEDGGIGATNSCKLKLKPSLEEFRMALGKIIQVRNSGRFDKEQIAFGTAIPFCLDSRMITEDLISNCESGTGFCAVNNEGDLRICNQSNRVYGNILKRSISEIWNDSKLNDYRDLNWVTGSCVKCPLLEICQCGCTVDSNCDCDYCIDYAMRDTDNIVKDNIKAIKSGNLVLNDHFGELVDSKKTMNLKILKVSPYLKCNTVDGINYLVTRYSSAEIGQAEKEIVNYLIGKNIINEKDLINDFPEFESSSLREFICNLEVFDALEMVK